MYVSIFLGPFSAGPHEDIPLIDLCLEQAVQAADAGFAMVTFGEQHFNGYEPYCNPFMMGARLAPFMKQTYYGTTVVPLPLHNPLRLAEDIAILDVLTRGKLIVGLSQGRGGFFSPDFETFGLDVNARKALFDVKLDLLLRLLEHRPGDPDVTFDEPWGKGAMTGRMMPSSWRAGRPQLSIGTNSNETIPSIGARGWPLFLGPCLLDDAAEKMQIYGQALSGGGHSPAVIDDCLSKSLVLKHVIVADTDEEAWAMAELMMGGASGRANTDGRSLRALHQADLSKEPPAAPGRTRTAAFVQAWVVAGSPDSVVRQLKAYEDAGVRQMHLRFTVGTYRPDEIRRSFDLFVRECLPRLNPQQFAPPQGAEVRRFESAAPEPVGA